MRPQLPILGSLSVEHIYRHQPLLFWTIIIVTTVHSADPHFAGVAERLQGPYLRMLQQRVLQSPLPLHQIQALLLLCHWPLPCDKQSKDPSWLYCGLAVNGARLLGLDRPQPAPDALESLGIAPEALHARVCTWLGCCYVSVS